MVADQRRIRRRLQLRHSTLALEPLTLMPFAHERELKLIALFCLLAIVVPLVEPRHVLRQRDSYLGQLAGERLRLLDVVLAYELDRVEVWSGLLDFFASGAHDE